MNRPKIRGTAAETAVVRWLQVNGFPLAERRALTGGQDRGDVSGIEGVCLEIKNHRAMDLGTWLKEMLVEKNNAKAKIGVVVHKRKGVADPGYWYATMTLADLTTLLERYVHGE